MAEALQLALEYYDREVHLGCDQLEAVMCLARASASHTAEVQAKQQQEHRQILQKHKQLQQELDELRKQQEERQLELGILRRHQLGQWQLQAEQQRQRQELDESRAMLQAIRPQQGD